MAEKNRIKNVFVDYRQSGDILIIDIDINKSSIVGGDDDKPYKITILYTNKA